MNTKELVCCDLCKMDGEDRKAIGWYSAPDGKDYDVCKKHAKDVEESGLTFHIFY